MLHDPAIETYAMQLLREEWQRDERQAGQHGSACDGQETCWTPAEVLELLTEHGHEPIDQLRPQVLALITEHQFVDESGDNVAEPDSDLEHEVQVLLRALDRVRTFAIARGHLLGTTTTPQMFG